MSAAERLVALFVAPPRVAEAPRLRVVPEPAPQVAPQPAARAVSLPAARAVPESAARAIPGVAARAVPGPAAQVGSALAARALLEPAAQAVAQPAAWSAAEPEPREAGAPRGRRVCILGGPASSAYAIASALARRPGRPSALLVTVTAEPVDASTFGALLPTAPTRAARRLARAFPAATARGRVVVMSWAGAPTMPHSGLALLHERAGEAAVVLHLPGARTAGFDAVLSEQDLVLVVPPANAPEALGTLAVAELTARTPGAQVLLLATAGRRGARARRLAVARVLEALR